MKVTKQHRHDSPEGFFTYVILSDLSKEDREDFERFLRGSAVPILPGVGDIAYSWDYDIWLGRRLKDVDFNTTDPATRFKDAVDKFLKETK